jgi:hypothetical protein
MGYWPGVTAMAATMALVVAVSWQTSPWFLLTLVVLVPVWNNLVLFVAGFVTPLRFGPAPVEVVLEEDRIGRA